jgi:hypothetical protein
MAKAYLPGRLSLTPVELAQGAGSTDGKQGERFGGHVVGGSGAVTPLLRDVEAPASRRGRRRPPPVTAALAALVVIAVWAAVRWSGTAPFGSDNDEYRLVAEALLAGEGPVVAGVEATKYPLGYPLLLALVDLASLPVTTVAMVANVVLVAVLGLVVVRLCAAIGLRAGAVPAAVHVVGGAGLWGSVFVTMPDLAFVVAAAVVLWWVGRVRSTRDVWLLVALVALATSLKSVGLLVALAASLRAAGACGRSPARRAPSTASLALTAAMAALGAGHPEHTTGYARTFLLVDPTDAAAGGRRCSGCSSGSPTAPTSSSGDVEMAVVGQQVPRPWSWLLVTVLLVAGTWALRSVATRRAYVVAFVAVWLPAMAVWPYSSGPVPAAAPADRRRRRRLAGRCRGAPRRPDRDGAHRAGGGRVPRELRASARARRRRRGGLARRRGHRHRGHGCLGGGRHPRGRRHRLLRLPGGRLPVGPARGRAPLHE